MARGRLLNKSVAASIKFHSLPDDTCRLMATWIISWLDKNGVWYADPAMVKSYVFPRRTDITADRVQGYLDEMENIGLIHRFENDGETWQVWPGFADNQPNLRRDRESTQFPLSPEQYRRAAGNTPATLQQDDGNKPAEGNLSEVNSSEEKKENASASANADIPANPDKTPTTFEQWLEYLKIHKNHPALVRRMIEIFYPGHDPPDYGYIGKTAKRLGRGINGYRRLMELLWKQHTDPPKGDLLPYIMAIAKNDSASARHFHDHKGDPPAEGANAPVEDDRTDEEKRLDVIWERALDELCSSNLGKTAIERYLGHSYLLEQSADCVKIVVHDELSSWLETDGWQRQIRQALGMKPDAVIAFEVETEA